MSVTCQFEQFASSYALSELSREVVIDSKLKIPETVPKIDSVIGGSIQMAAPVVSVNADTNSLLISGVIYPQLYYTSAESIGLSGNHRPDYNSLDQEESQNADIDSTRREPKEYSYSWSGENGIIYEEQIEITGLEADNLVDVQVVPKNCDFERSGADRINFSARVIIMVHPTGQKQAAIIKDLAVQPLEKVNMSKEQITSEQLNDVKQVILPVQAPLLLPSLKPGISRVIHCGVQPYHMNWEYNRGKIYLKGFLDVSMVYVGLDDDDLPTDIMANEWNRDSGNPVAFETHFDTEIPEENLLVVPSVTVLNTDLIIKSRREIQCQVTLECRATISRIHSSEIVTEVTPGPGTLLDIQKGFIHFEEYVGEVTGEISFELSADLPPGQPGAERLLTCQGQFLEPKVEVTDGSAAIEGNLNLRALYMSDGPGGPELHMARWESRYNNQLPVAGMIDFPNVQPGSLLRVQTGIESLKAEFINDRSLKVTGQIKAHLLARNPRSLPMIEDCAEVIPVDPETRPSMLFYIVQPGDTLWKIARRYQTTMAQLLQSNQISSPDRIEVGQKLLIPKQAG